MGYIRALTVASLVLCTRALAQRTPPPFLAAYTQGRAYILLTEMPGGTAGFNIYCKRGKKFERLNGEPIRPVKDPLVFREVLGEDYRWVARAVKAKNPLQTLRRIEGDPGTGFAMSLASLRVAAASGRLFVDTTAVEGKTWYRVAYLDYRGREFASREVKVKLEEARPGPPEDLKLEAGDGRVKVSWDYPPYTGRPEDIAVGFNIYRRREGEDNFMRINPLIVLRQEGKLYRFDRKVENGTTYTYYVTAVDFVGRESRPSKREVARPKDLTPPLIPEGIRAISEEGRITIVWRMNLELDLSHYDIYRSTSPTGSFSKINPEPIPGDRPSFVDTDVRYGAYFYKVRAVDRSGNEGKLSGAVYARCKDLTPPPPPTDISYEVTEHKVSLSWKPPPDPSLLGYYVYRGDREDRLIRLSGEPLGEPSFLDPGYRGRGLIPGRTYYYGVSALDEAMNESEISSIPVRIPDDVPPVAPPSCRARTTAEGKVKVRWQPSPSPDVVLYRIYRAEEGKEPSLLKEVGGEVLLYLDRDVERGRKYIYSVSAVDSVGNEGRRSEEFSVVARDSDPPPVPTGVDAVVTDRGVLVTWHGVEVEDLAGYYVYRSDMRTGVFRKLNREAIRKAEFLDEEGEEGFYYKVTSLDTSGNENRRARAVRAHR